MPPPRQEHPLPTRQTPAPPPSNADPQTQLAHVAAASQHCQACPLWEIGAQTVFGQGPAAARLLFIDEDRGRNEDKHGLPFVGAALLGFGVPVQESLFECRLPPAQLAPLRRAIRNIVRPRLDNVRLYHLCGDCADRRELLTASAIEPAPDVYVV